MTPNQTKGARVRRVKKQKSVNHQPVDVLKSLMGEMYDRLAAKMVVALYREKGRLLAELSHRKKPLSSSKKKV